jgi:hypothetical protein
MQSNVHYFTLSAIWLFDFSSFIEGGRIYLFRFVHSVSIRMQGSKIGCIPRLSLYICIYYTIFQLKFFIFIFRKIVLYYWCGDKEREKIEMKK